MAIGVDGGFKSDIKKDEFEDKFKIVVLPDFQEFAVDDQEVPLAIQMSAKAVIQADSAIHKAEVEAAAGSWDGEALVVSKFAENLEQLNNGVQIPPNPKIVEM